VSLFAKNLDVTGNVTNLIAPSPSVSWFARIPTAYLKLSAALALWELLEFLNLSLSSRKLNQIRNAASARNKTEIILF
jgi:hypothetical protein